MKAGVFFHVPAEDRNALLEWVRRTDQRIIRHHIEEYGRALVVMFHRPGGSPHPGYHLAQIETVPEPGAAMPYVGPLGGGYELIFAPCPEGYRLTVHVPAVTLQLSDLTDGSFAGELPYDLPLSLPFTRIIRAPILCDEEIRQLRRRDLPAAGGRSDILSYNLTPPDGDCPMIYGFGEACFDLFRSWEHFREDLSAFAFIFRPYNDGCDIRVRYLSQQPELPIR